MCVRVCVCILTVFYLRVLRITAYFLTESQKLKPMWYALFREKPLSVVSLLHVSTLLGYRQGASSSCKEKCMEILYCIYQQPTYAYTDVKM